MLYPVPNVCDCDALSVVARAFFLAVVARAIRSVLVCRTLFVRDVRVAFAAVRATVARPVVVVVFALSVRALVARDDNMSRVITPFVRAELFVAVRATTDVGVALRTTFDPSRTAALA